MSAPEESIDLSIHFNVDPGNNDEDDVGDPLLTTAPQNPKNLPDFPSNVKEVKLERIRKKYEIPSYIDILLPKPFQRIYAPPRGYLGIHIDCLKNGFRIPMHRDIQNMLLQIGISPSQLKPNGMGLLVSLFIYLQSKGIQLTWKNFSMAFKFAKSRGTHGYCTVMWKDHSKMFRSLTSSHGDWKSSWVWLRAPRIDGRQSRWKIVDEWNCDIPKDSNITMNRPSWMEEWENRAEDDGLYPYALLTQPLMYLAHHTSQPVYCASRFNLTWWIRFAIEKARFEKLQRKDCSSRSKESYFGAPTPNLAVMFFPPDYPYIVIPHETRPEGEPIIELAEDAQIGGQDAHLQNEDARAKDIVVVEHVENNPRMPVTTSPDLEDNINMEIFNRFGDTFATILGTGHTVDDVSRESEEHEAPNVVHNNSLEVIVLEHGKGSLRRRRELESENRSRNVCARLDKIVSSEEALRYIAAQPYSAQAKHIEFAKNFMLNVGTVPGNRLRGLEPLRLQFNETRHSLATLTYVHNVESLNRRKFESELQTAQGELASLHTRLEIAETSRANEERRRLTAEKENVILKENLELAESKARKANHARHQYKSGLKHLSRNFLKSVEMVKSRVRGTRPETSHNIEGSSSSSSSSSDESE